MVTFVGKLHEKKRLWFSTLNTTNSRFVNTHYYGHLVYINWIPRKTNKSLPETNSIYYYGTCAILWTSGIFLGLNSMISKFQLLLQFFSRVGLLLVFVVSVCIFFRSIRYKIEKTSKRKQLPTVIMHSPLLSNRTQ